jgi:hypothetical protein
VGNPISPGELLRRQIAVRTEGHTIIATVPTGSGLRNRRERHEHRTPEVELEREGLAHGIDPG